jgi:hypothetical protein
VSFAGVRATRTCERGPPLHVADVLQSEFPYYFWVAGMLTSCDTAHIFVSSAALYNKSEHRIHRTRLIASVLVEGGAPGCDDSLAGRMRSAAASCDERGLGLRDQATDGRGQGELYFRRRELHSHKHYPSMYICDMRLYVYMCRNGARMPFPRGRQPETSPVVERSKDKSTHKFAVRIHCSTHDHASVVPSHLSQSHHVFAGVTSVSCPGRGL